MGIDILTGLTARLLPVAKQMGRVIGAKAPEILLGTGILAIGTGTVLACKTSVDKVPDILQRQEDELAEMASEDNAERKDVARVYFKTSIELARAYALPTALIGTGIGCVVGGHVVQARRIAVVGGMYNTLLASFNEYRERVVENEGEAQDRKYLYGEEEKTIVEEKEGKNGKVKKKDISVKVLGSGSSDDIYHVLFSRETAATWTKDADYNLSFLLTQQRIFTQRLHARGYVFLDEVFEALGISLEGRSNAKNVGWMLGIGDDCVDFGLYSPDVTFQERLKNAMAIDDETIKRSEEEILDAKELFLLGAEPNVWLDFNCDGYILDKI